MSRVLICPEQWSSSRIITLPDPRHGQQRQYLLTQQGMYEVMRWSDDVPRSWIIGDMVQEDGSFYVCMRVDPLFLVIPYLTKAKKDKNVFTTLDVMLPFQEHPGFRHLDTDPERQDLHGCLDLVCDVKGSGDVRAFRLNDEKLLRWLKAKTIMFARQLPDHLTSTGATSANFVARASAAKDIPYELKLNFAFGAVSRYLSPDLEDLLRSELGIRTESDAVGGDGSGDQDGQQLGKYAGLEPTDDYSKTATAGNQDDNPGKKAKLTAAQKRLAKVDKTGMKSIASFFGGGAKKKKSK
ncbi:hypothetical protein PTSG_00267 [Salpingoeca rosetta]|uniref:Ribonuclease H2 subunit B n=1 Tax=Salpingoeca rosetta (strain ATCC 50818 / BSB-021) TaxID=946362 RepID=F2TW00_SALR5|nr:uncharacterized protein PTSG_00267 [Salpingoeca rosetta]EGD72246.1 hypothetical protein PTSG_00267 [Salpingoeca rosetta]|eukprot:XP_004998817.1 hypothetical protein PTSG_00267 [Salpingoeca rosetta]